MAERYISLARQSIENKLGLIEKVDSSFDDLKNIVGAFFVTLKIDNELRGCIGSMEAYRSVYDDIVGNALNAAFRDPRFLPLTADEYKRCKIEVSQLSPRTKISYKCYSDLKDIIKPSIHGVYLQKGYNSSTFLPQVWEELNDFDQFFFYLCKKGNLQFQDLMNGEIEIFIYTVNIFSEN
ncbi:MAG: AmmeMemoRadiSam system protein A [Candidatus Delongbacteria bacterium]|nr:AmmeMemoRadiSam system protein A [Candidatus Delongbacteria bacterium]MBN2837005.1 AmmeMemoRadiSam system protein A [Candidatus Delongbacteria bacterium]